MFVWLPTYLAISRDLQLHLHLHLYLYICRFLDPSIYRSVYLTTGYEILLHDLGLVHVGTGWVQNLWQFRAGSMMIKHLHWVTQLQTNLFIDVMRDCNIHPYLAFLS